MTDVYVPQIYRCPRNCGNYITRDEWNPQTGRCKYCPSPQSNAGSVTEANVTFGSQKEYRRAKDLQAKVSAGKITNLRTHTTYDLIINGVEVGRYVDDFSYDDLGAHGRHIVEDVKPPDIRKTQEYKRCRKLMQELYGIEIVEF
jgi:hypothetical protein